MKAFDSVPHAKLITSLSSIGISGPLLKWFCDYLTDRCRRVVLDGVSSGVVPVTSGDPLLGPLIFNIFTNPISNLSLSQNAKMILYADDILFYKPVNSSMQLC